MNWSKIPLSGTRTWTTIAVFVALLPLPNKSCYHKLTPTSSGRQLARNSITTLILNYLFGLDQSVCWYWWTGRISNRQKPSLPLISSNIFSLAQPLSYAWVLPVYLKIWTLLSFADPHVSDFTAADQQVENYQEENSRGLGIQADHAHIEPFQEESSIGLCQQIAGKRGSKL